MSAKLHGRWSRIPGNIFLRSNIVIFPKGTNTSAELGRDLPQSIGLSTWRKTRDLSRFNCGPVPGVIYRVSRKKNALFYIINSHPCTRLHAATAVFQRSVFRCPRSPTERVRHPFDGYRGTVATATGGSPRSALTAAMCIEVNNSTPSAKARMPVATSVIRYHKESCSFGFRLGLTGLLPMSH
jgi:hypothetical protein